jgi:hypothetical protein
MKPSSRGGEADEAIQAFLCGPWIASLSLAMTANETSDTV